MRRDNIWLIKNTIAQYVKIVVSAFCGLLAVRVVLQELGVSDYGIYTLIAGFVAFLGVLNSAMIVSTQRFISVEISKGDFGRITSIYSSSVLIHILLSVIILIIAETIGLYAINHWLNFPDGSKLAVNVVYQCTVFTFLFNVISIPQQAALIAYEKIYISATIGIVESILRLVAAYVLYFVSDSKLITYAVLILAISLLTRGAYNIITIRTTKLKYSHVNSRSHIGSLVGFAWWNLFGGIAMIGKVQGVNIVLNILYGTVINTSYSIANQINSQLMFFSSSIFQSSNSQTIQAWQKKDTFRLDFLLQKVSKIAFSLFLLITIPIFTLTGQILNVWLGTIPEYADVFLKLMILNSFVEMFSTPISFVIQSTGNIKRYSIVISLTLITIIPISYVFLKIGYPPQTVISVTIITNLIVLIIRGYFLKKLASYNPTTYFVKTIIPCFVCVALSLILPFYFLTNTFNCNNYIITGICEVISIILIVFFIFSPVDRRKFVTYAKSKI